MSDNSQTAGIILQDQEPIDTDIHIKKPEWSVSKLHNQLFDPAENLGHLLFKAVQDLISGQSPSEARQTLRDVGVSAMDGGYAELAVASVRGIDQLDDGSNTGDLSYWDFLGVTRELGTGSDRLNLRSSKDDLWTGALPIFSASVITPTVCIVLDDKFTSTRRDQREEIIDLIIDLAQGCEVYLITGSIENEFLWTQHRDQLPASVVEQCNSRLALSPRSESFNSRLQAARDDLDTDSPAAQILRLMHEHPAELMTYSELESSLSQERSTIRYHVTQRLQELDLVHRVNHHGSAAVSLSLLGLKLAESIFGESADGGGDKPSVEGASNSSDDIREAPGEHGTPPSPEAAEGGSGCSGVAKVQPYSRSEATAVIAGSEDTEIGVINHPIPEYDDIREGRWWFDADHQELVVGAQWKSPLQYGVSLALALTSPKTWEHAMPPDVLDDEIFDRYPFSYPWFLRGTRQLGYLKNDDMNGDDYIDALLAAREDLYEMLNKLEYGNYSDQQRELRRDILREAHGLIGVVTHMADLCDITLHREMRIPDYARDFNKEDRREEIFRFLSKAVPIGSRYDQFTAEKHLFEAREKKRKWALCEPEVDAADPVGEFIGSWTIVGSFFSTEEEFLDGLTQTVQQPAPLQDDLPKYADFEVEVDVSRVDHRSAYETATSRMLDAKNILMVNEAINWLQSLTGSVYDVVDALHWLGAEDYDKVESRDLIYALSTLDRDRLLPDAKPTVRAILDTLLEVAADKTHSGNLSKAEIADRAGISDSSVYNSAHWEVLDELDIISNVDGGWEISISLPTDRGDPDLPWWMEKSMTTITDAVYRIQCRVEASDPTCSFDSSAVFDALQWPPDFDDLVDAWPLIEKWIDVITSILNQGPDTNPSKTVVRFGNRPTQLSLEESVNQAVSSQSSSTI